MSTVHTKAWMASPEYLGRSFKWKVFEDAGALQIAPGALRFHGKNREVSLSDAIAVSLVRQPIPWLTMFTEIGLIAALVSSGVLQHLRWDDPVTIGLCVGVTAFFFLAAGPVQWVKVDYQNESGAAGVVYFLNGAGLARFFGGTRKLYSEIQAAVCPPRS